MAEVLILTERELRAAVDLGPAVVDAMEGAASADELEELGAALDTLARVDPGMAQLVDLHFFCGFTFAEVAELRGVSLRTVHRDWRTARLLLHRTLVEPDR